MNQQNPIKDQNKNPNLFEYNDDDLNGEWSFNLGSSFNSTELENNESDVASPEKNTIVVDRCAYEELVTTCNSITVELKGLKENLEKKEKECEEKDMEYGRLKKCKEEFEKLEVKHEEIVVELMETKGKLKDLVDQLEKKETENKEIKKNANRFEDEYKKLEIDYGNLMERTWELQNENKTRRTEIETFEKKNSELMEMLKRKEEETIAKSDSLREKSDQLEHVNKKYNNLKKQGLQMLEQRDVEIKTMQTEMSEQKMKYQKMSEQLTMMELAAKTEKEKRKKFENEMKIADQMIRDALREEKISRKQVEKKCLTEKTEKIALQEQMNELNTRGVVRIACPISEHNFLEQRIDVLQRQRSLLVDSINQRDSHDVRK